MLRFLEMEFISFVVVVVVDDNGDLILWFVVGIFRNVMIVPLIGNLEKVSIDGVYKSGPVDFGAHYSRHFTLTTDGLYVRFHFLVPCKHTQIIYNLNE